MTTVIDLNFNFIVLRASALMHNNVTATAGEIRLAPMRVCPRCQRYACVDAADMAEHFAEQHGEKPG